tara:strand:+ start:895 stop:1380 length:486 start_codon:yes stop_codon:yes gene_type:complete
MKNVFIALSLSCLTASAAASSSDLLDNYGKLAQLTTQQINTASYKEVGAASSKLVDIAKQFLPAFSLKNPVCKEYVDAVMKAADTMQKISLEEIEADYHHDGKLPKVADGSCYHAKDLLVHPATVVVMASKLKDTKANRESMAAELYEVIAHLGAVKQAVK